AGQVFRALEGEGRDVGERAGTLGFVFGAMSMRRVFDHDEFVFAGDGVDGAHVARDPAEVDGDDRFGSRRDGALDLLRVDVERVELDVDEYGRGVCRDGGRGGGEERV